VFHAHFVTQSTNGRTFLPRCATGGTVAAVSRAWPVILLLALASGVQAHPSIENGMQIVVAREHVTLEARVSLDEVDIAHEIPSAGGPNIDMAKLGDVLKTHADYLVNHFDVRADGKPLVGKVARIAPPTAGTEGIPWTALETTRATFVLEYALPAAPAPLPKEIAITHKVLAEYRRLGQPWAVNFIVQVRQDDQAQWTQSILTREQPLRWTCTWHSDDVATTAPVTATRLDLAQTARQYTWHGLHHILTGYDHLLFVAALVIAAASLWDLVKVVSAFTVAHTLTLTLSVLNLVRLPSHVVEPIIAASIVCVAVQNVLFPRQSRGWARLAIAFTFGLFHGLGFAGGLMDAMADMPGMNLAAALICFTIGVELAHQMLIVPLFYVLRFVRRRSATMEDASPALPPPLPMSLRFASVLISLAGTVYFVQALRSP
jgi:hydrogenase/urease accessory protein HupE